MHCHRSLGDRLDACVESKQDFWVCTAARSETQAYLWPGWSSKGGLGRGGGRGGGGYCSCVTRACTARVSHHCAGCSHELLFFFVQDALGVDAFNVSSEALIADSLFDAYRAADEAAIKKLILSKPIFTQLDNQVRSCRKHASEVIPVQSQSATDLLFKPRLHAKLFA